MIEPQTISIRMAMKLASEDYPQNISYWYWTYRLKDGMWKLVSWKELATIDELECQIYAAPTSGELALDMPVGFKSSKRGEKDYVAWYYDYEYLESLKQNWEAETEEDVRGNAWIWLNENNLLRKMRQSKQCAFIAQVEEAEANGPFDFLRTRADKVENI